MENVLSNINLQFSNSDNELERINCELLPLRMKDIDRQLGNNRESIHKLDYKLDSLSNYADKFDYYLAAASGILAGVIDSVYVGRFNFTEFNKNSYSSINNLIEKFAEYTGFKGKGLDRSVQYLENSFPVAQDNIWKDKGITSARLHHLDDVAHHPTPAGLIAATMVDFLKIAPFSDNKGNIHFLHVKGSDNKNMESLLIASFISGTISWLSNLAESGKYGNDRKEIPKPVRKLIKFLSTSTPVLVTLKTTIKNWLGHLMSDIGGSRSTAGAGMGIPGVFLSLLKELSCLPGINQTYLPQLVNEWYSKDRIDFRKEFSITTYAGKQSVPVVVNECIVRTFYFVRHLLVEKNGKGWRDVYWNRVKPWGNRTVTRMIAVASGAFVSVDCGSAAMSASEFAANPYLYATEFALRINYTGISEFTVALYSDIKMSIERSKQIRKEMKLYQDQLNLYGMKIDYIDSLFKEQVQKVKKIGEVVDDKIDKAIREARNNDSNISTTIQDIGRLLNTSYRSDDDIITSLDNDEETF